MDFQPSFCTVEKYTKFWLNLLNLLKILKNPLKLRIFFDILEPNHSFRRALWIMFWKFCPVY